MHPKGASDPRRTHGRAKERTKRDVLNNLKEQVDKQRKELAVYDRVKGRIDNKLTELNFRCRMSDVVMGE